VLLQPPYIRDVCQWDFIEIVFCFK